MHPQAKGPPGQNEYKSNISPNEPILNTALGLAKGGFAVFPCDDSNRPRTKHGLHDATTEETQIRKWWSRWPNARIGVRMGNGIVALDIDVKNGKPGKQSWQALTAKHGFVDTRTHITLSGGLHLLFRVDEPIGNSVEKLGPGLDVRGDGGYIIWYSKDTSSPDSPAKMPAWLVRLLKDNGGTDKKAQLPEVLKEGERNTRMASLAGAMRRIGANETEILAALKETNKRCEPPLPAAELAKIAGSISRYEPESDKSSGLADTIVGNLKTWREILEDKNICQEYVIEGLAPKYGLIVLGGAAKQGKTRLAIALSHDIAAGRNALGRETQQAPVIYINFECSTAYAKELMKELGTEPPGNLLWVDFPEPKMTLEGLKIIVSHMKKRFATDHVVLVIDSLRGAYQLKEGQENDPGVVGRHVRELGRLAKEVRATVFLIHHHNKKQDLAGSADISAGADAIWRWYKPRKREPGTLEVDGRLPPVEAIKVELDRGARCLGGAEELNLNEKKKRVLESLTDTPMTALDIADLLNEGLPEQEQIKPGRVKQILGELYDEGKTIREGEGVKGDAFRYTRSERTLSVEEIAEELGAEEVEGVPF